MSGLKPLNVPKAHKLVALLLFKPFEPAAEFVAEPVLPVEEIV